MNIYQKTLNICKNNNIKPARSKGQNFLINEEAYDSIVKASDLQKDDIVLEVGPGLGFLTRKLAEKVKKVVAVELDDKLAELLKASLKKEGVENVEVWNMNVLDFFEERRTANYKLCPKGANSSRELFKFLDCKLQDYKIVANLPYNITSVFLKKFLTAKNKPKTMVLMLQKEVAERIVASPGKMSVLAVSVQFYARPEMLFAVSREDFYPAPKVDSAVIKIDVTDCGLQVASEKDFFRLVKHGFSSKRKMLKKNLAGGYRLLPEKVIDMIKDIGFSEKARAQELSVEDWVKLLGKF